MFYDVKATAFYFIPHPDWDVAGMLDADERNEGAGKDCVINHGGGKDREQ
jgi:hypothetical protein